MTTGWTDYPATADTRIQALLLNEVRAAIEAAGYSPGWTDGSRLDANDPIRAKHATELRDAIQNRWSTRGLGLIPNWSSGHEPGGTSTGAQETPVLFSDINDIRRWFNHFETWGDLRGVHWFDAAQTQSPLPKVGWNVESVIGVATAGDGFDQAKVDFARDRCAEARNYGLVNIVRLDYKPNQAVPTSSGQYQGWINKITSAVNILRPHSTMFVIGNEPNAETEGWVSSGLYTAAFNALYAQKVTGVSYLAAGPGLWAPEASPIQPENDLDWLTSVAANLSALDGWALHTYGSPYLQYASSGGVACSGLCTDPRQSCNVTCDPNPGTLTGDASFLRFRQLVDAVRVNWATKPVYVTETNTYGWRHDPPGQPDRKPNTTYINGWLQNAFHSIRDFNVANNPQRSSYPPVLSLCWFVDGDRGDINWIDFALVNPALSIARSNFIASETSTGIE